MSIQTAAIDRALEILLDAREALTIPGTAFPLNHQDHVLDVAIANLSHALDRCVIVDSTGGVAHAC